MHVRVVKIRGLSPDTKAEAFSTSAETEKSTDQRDGVAIEINSPLTALDADTPAKARERVVNKVLEQLPATKASKVKVAVSVPELQLERQSALRDVTKEGTVDINGTVDLALSALQAAVEVRVLNQRGFRLGTAAFRAANLPDGSTAFWASGRDGRAIAKRWQSGSAVWRMTLALEGTDGAEVVLDVSMDPWEYSLDQTTPKQFRTGLQSIVAVQVVEARGLMPKDFNGKSDPYVTVSYNKRTASTGTVWESLDPVFGSVLLFKESRSMLERRIRVDVFDRDRNKDAGEALGWGYYNLDLVAEGQVTDQWIQLRNVVAGELRLRFVVLNGTDDNDAVREDCIRQLEAAPMTYTSDIIKCSVDKVEGLTALRGKSVAVEAAYTGVQRTDNAKIGSDGAARWDADLRFRRGKKDADHQLLRLTLYEGGSTRGRGREVGRATVDLAVVLKRLELLRKQNVDRDNKKAAPAVKKQQRLSAARLLAGDVGAVRDQRRRAAQVKVAEPDGEQSGQRTEIMDIALPLQGAGGDARLYLKLQGALGQNEELQLNDFQRAVTVDSDEDGSVAAAPLTLLASLQQFSRNIASRLFD